MSGYRTVVVGTDGSQTSLVAVDRAAELARAVAGRIPGSVPLDVARHAGTDVLIVHTA